MTIFPRPIILLLGVLALVGVIGTGIFLVRHHHEARTPRMTEPVETVPLAKPADLLTPEQMAMWRREHRSELRTMNEDQKRVFRRRFRLQLEAMSEADRNALRAHLQAQFDALPADEKQKVASQIAKQEHERGAKAGGTGGNE